MKRWLPIKTLIRGVAVEKVVIIGANVCCSFFFTLKKSVFLAKLSQFRSAGEKNVSSSSFSSFSRPETESSSDPKMNCIFGVKGAAAEIMFFWDLLLRGKSELRRVKSNRIYKLAQCTPQTRSCAIDRRNICKKLSWNIVSFGRNSQTWFGGEKRCVKIKP